MLHLAALAFSYAFAALGWWQWERRIRLNPETGVELIDWQNTFYAFQWWFFAVFAVWFWWKFLSDGFKIERSEIS